MNKAYLTHLLGSCNTSNIAVILVVERTYLITMFIVMNLLHIHVSNMSFSVLLEKT
jgi:hypothetical protein